MAVQKSANYTAELTAAIVDQYTSGQGVEAIAEAIGKSVRSVRSKLVREGGYVAAEKPKGSARELGPTKKELLIELEALVSYPVEGLMGATKEAIAALIANAKI